MEVRPVTAGNGTARNVAPNIPPTYDTSVAYPSRVLNLGLVLTSCAVSRHGRVCVNDKNFVKKREHTV